MPYFAVALRGRWIAQISDLARSLFEAVFSTSLKIFTVDGCGEGVTMARRNVASCLEEKKKTGPKTRKKQWVLPKRPTRATVAAA